MNESTTFDPEANCAFATSVLEGGRMEMEESLTNEVSNKASTGRRMLLKASLGVALGGAMAAVGLGETSAARKLRDDWATCRDRCECESGICEIAEDGRRRCIPRCYKP